MTDLTLFCNEAVKIWDKHARELDREKQVSEELTTKARSTFETKRQVCCYFSHACQFHITMLTAPF